MVSRRSKKGDADAQYNLGTLYLFGRGVSRDYKKAFKWYQKAAKKNHTYAISRLGDMYKKGIGVTKNYQESIKMYEKSCVIEIKIYLLYIFIYSFVVFNS